MAWLHRLRTIGTILSGTWAAMNLWSLIQTHLSPLPSAIITDPHFRSFLHFGGFALGVGILIALNWKWIHHWRMKDKDRLHSLFIPAEAVYDTLRLADNKGWDDISWGPFDRKLHCLQRELEDLGLTPPPRPSTRESRAVLGEWLLEFLVVAKNGNIGAARELSSLGLLRYKKKRKPLG